jgi:hypothetical protein
MPDDIKNQSAGEGADKGAGAGEGQNNASDDKSKGAATDTGNEDAGKGEGTDKGGEGADQKDTSKGQEGQEKNAKAPNKDTQKDNDDIDDGKEPEVKPRMSTKDFIIQRQKAKLAKKAKAGEGEEGDGKGNEAGEDDEEFAPEDVSMINKVVSKTFAPIIDKTLAADDEREIQDFLTVNPDFKPFEAKARRYMQHPSRRQLPIKSIFYEVAGDKLMKIGADRAKAADEKAKSTQTGGGSNRAGEGAKSDWDLPKDEFEAKQERIRRGQQS